MLPQITVTLGITGNSIAVKSVFQLRWENGRVQKKLGTIYRADDENSGTIQCANDKKSGTV